MKKLLSLSLALVMMLSCVLGQAVLVSAADAVDTNNAPYAGVYAVTSDVATTVTTEAGSVTELAAGETGYTFLVKGANQVTVSPAANLTITALEDNGKAYYSQVSIPTEPIIMEKQEDKIAAAAGVTLAPGESRDFTYTPSLGLAGITYPYIAFSTNTEATIRVITDTGFYGDIYNPAGVSYSSTAWADAAHTDPEMVYIRSGEQTITLKNIGSNVATFYAVAIHRAGASSLLANPQWTDQMKMTELKVVSSEPEPTPDPTPTPTPTPTPEPFTGISYEAPLAGVYAVSSDADVTLTSEIGSVAELAAGETKYIYLIAGVNNIETTNEDANVTFTALEDNGMDYFDQVTIANEPIISGQEDLYGWVSIGIAIAAGETYTIEYTPSQGLAGMVYPYIAFGTGDEATLRLTSDTGFYADIYNPAGTSYSSRLTTDAAGTDIELLYVRGGKNTITLENIGSNDILLYTVRFHSVGELVNHATWGSQLNVANLKPAAEEEEILADTDVTVNGNELTFYGKVGADYLDLDYGVEFAANKLGTRAQRYRGAKDGDTVAADENATSTTVFTFGEWDGTFNIVLKNVSAGEKTYKFFVGENYSEEATVTVE